MAYVDAQTLLSDAQAVTADANSTNTYDTGSATNDITRGEPVAVVLTIDVAADFTTTDETYIVNVIESAAANLSSPTTISSRTILASALTAGSIHVFVLGPGSKTKRYLGVAFDVGGTTPTVTGTIYMTLASMAPVSATYYPDAITIS